MRRQAAISSRDISGRWFGFLLLCILSSLMSLHAIPTTAQECLPTGDVNQDGQLTPRDGLLVLRNFLAEERRPETQCQGDVDRRSAGITPADTLCILQRFLHLPSCLDPPVAQAGEDQFVAPSPAGSFPDIILDGSNSTIIAGITPQYQWRLTELPAASQATLSAANTAMATFTPDVRGLYTLRLTVVGQLDLSASDTVWVNVQAPATITPLPCACFAQRGEEVNLEVELTACVTDDTGAPVPLWPVTFTRMQGSGEFVGPSTVFTDELSGCATVIYRRNAGDNAVPLAPAVLAPGSSLRGATATAISTTGVDNTGTAEAIVDIIEARAQDVRDPAIFVIGLESPNDIDIGDDGSLFVVDDALGLVLKIDPHTGELTVVSGRGRGRGPNAFGLTGVTVESDRNLAVVGVFVDSFNVGFHDVVRVGLGNGNREVVSGLDPTPPAPLRGDGPSLFGEDFFRGIARNPIDNSLWVVGGFATSFNMLRDQDVVARIDPETGDRTIVSGCTEFAPMLGCIGPTRGSGPALLTLQDIAVDADGTLLVVGEFCFADADCTPLDDGSASSFVFGGVVRVNANTGDRTVVSYLSALLDPTTMEETTFTSCPPPLYFNMSPFAAAVEADGQVVVVNNQGLFDLPTIVRVNPRQPPEQNCTVVARERDPTVGDGVRLIEPTGIAVEADGNLVVVDRTLRSVVRINLTTGDRDFVFRGTSFGTGRPLVGLSTIAVESSGDLVVADGGIAPAVIRVDARNGNRTVVSGLKDLFLDSFCNLQNGNEPPLAGGIEPPFFYLIADVAVEANGNLLVVGAVQTSCDFENFSDVLLTGVIRVDPMTGKRELVSGCRVDMAGQCMTTDPGRGRGLGPPLLSPPESLAPLAIAVEDDGQIVVVEGVNFAGDGQFGDGQRGVLRIDPTTGDRSLIGCRDPETGDTIACRCTDPPTGTEIACDFSDPHDIAIDAEGNLFVLDPGGLGIVRMHPVHGTRTIVPIISGPPPSSMDTITVDRGNNTLILGESRAITRLHPTSGHLAVITGGDLVTGPARALTYWAEEDAFVYLAFEVALFRLNRNGEATLIGYLDHVARSLTFVGPRLYSISSPAAETNAQLREIDLHHATTLSRVPLNLPDIPVNGGIGLATHPQTGQLWSLLTPTADETRFELARIDATTGMATSVGSLVDVFDDFPDFQALTFTPDGTLYGLTEGTDEAPQSDRLFILSTIDASPTCVLQLRRSDLGTGIAVRPATGLLYVLSGAETDPSGLTFEIIDLSQPTACDAEPTTVPLPLTFSGRGSGLPLGRLADLAVTNDGHLVYVDEALQAVVRVNPLTGNRTIISR